MKVPVILVLTAVTFFGGCASRYVDPLSLPLVDRSEDLAPFEGKEVRLAGEVSNSKMPEILGVDIESDDPDLRGKQGEAYGVLKRYVVTEAEVRDVDRQMIAHRGAGTFWVLQDPKTKAPAKVGPPAVVCIITVPGSAEKSRTQRQSQPQPDKLDY